MSFGISSFHRRLQTLCDLFIHFQTRSVMIMASSSPVKYLNWPKISVILILMFLSLTLFFSSNSGDESVTVLPSPSSDHIVDSDDDLMKRMKKVLGSKPPRCVNKCLNCRPCMAALVISQHRNNGANESPHDRETSYYLLAWKCKCRDKIFQP